MKKINDNRNNYTYLTEKPPSRTTFGWKTGEALSRSHGRRSMGKATTRCKWSSATTAICNHEAIVAPRRSAGDWRQWWQQLPAMLLCVVCRWWDLTAGDLWRRPLLLQVELRLWSWGYYCIEEICRRLMKMVVTISEEEEGKPHSAYRDVLFKG